MNKHRSKDWTKSSYGAYWKLSPEDERSCFLLVVFFSKNLENRLSNSTPPFLQKLKNIFLDLVNKKEWFILSLCFNHNGNEAGEKFLIFFYIMSHKIGNSCILNIIEPLPVLWDTQYKCWIYNFFIMCPFLRRKAL